MKCKVVAMMATSGFVVENHQDAEYLFKFGVDGINLVNN